MCSDQTVKNPTPSPTAEGADGSTTMVLCRSTEIRKVVKVEGKRRAAENRYGEILEWNSSLPGIWAGVVGSASCRTMRPKHTAEATLQWFKNKRLPVLKASSQSSDLWINIWDMLGLNARVSLGWSSGGYSVGGWGYHHLTSWKKYIYLWVIMTLYDFIIVKRVIFWNSSTGNPGSIVCVHRWCWL